RLELHHPLHLRSEVRLDLVLGDQIVNVDGTVGYLEVVDDPVCCMGIAFRNLDGRAKMLISEVMDESETEA
ncbi:MAG: hypothetical protein MI919_26645, partial [Holophagales bacterium]|nr:hypothetical protein [Holophagales bacterium]